MGENLKRRLFFKKIVSSATGFLNQVVLPGDHDGGAQPEMSSDIMGDLTPELLEMEALRLGLDPIKDQNRVLQSIQAAMSRPGGRETRMG
ncbi:MAG: hypothetical protein GY860_17050 [Desulfobacteraceae bacterium]|nr:hypothetical protein [Desulfobacteraceae bacterium]